MKWFDLPEREAGRIYVCLFIFMIGAALTILKIDYGTHIMGDAASALFAFMQTAKAGTHAAAVNVENVNMPEGK